MTGLDKFSIYSSSVYVTEEARTQTHTHQLKFSPSADGERVGEGEKKTARPWQWKQVEGSIVDSE